MSAVTELPRGTTDLLMPRVFPQPSPYQDDPAGWFEHRLGSRLWSVQQRIVETVRDRRHTAVYGCHDFGKSYAAAGLACWWIDSHPVGEAFVVSTAPSQPQVDTILWREMRAMHDRGALRGRIPPATPKWYLDSGELVAFGRKPQDYVDAAQAMQAFQGIHARYVLVLLDEAGGIPEWLFDAADTLAANENSRVVALGNPDDPSSHFAKVCRPGEGWERIQVSAFDTPAFTGETVSPQLLDKLIGRTWVEERRKRWGEKSPRFVSKVLGLFPDISDDTLITPRMIDQAHALELPGIARGGYGGDVARYGDSETVAYRHRGGVIRLVATAHKQDTEETADLFGGILYRHGADRIPMVVDGVGLGAGVVDKLRHRGLPVIDFNGAERARDEERFANRRAETYWQFREGLEAGEIDLDPLDEDLASQLQSIKWKLDGRGRILIESKDDMRKRGVASPDRADAAVQAYGCPPSLGQALLAAQLDDAQPSHTAELRELLGATA